MRVQTTRSAQSVPMCLAPAAAHPYSRSASSASATKWADYTAHAANCSNVFTRVLNPAVKRHLMRCQCHTLVGEIKKLFRCTQRHRLLRQTWVKPQAARQLLPRHPRPQGKLLVIRHQCTAYLPCHCVQIPRVINVGSPTPYTPTQLLSRAVHPMPRVRSPHPNQRRS